MTRIAVEIAKKAPDWFEPGVMRFEQMLDGARPALLRELGRQGFLEFLRQGFPATDQEDWRFTNLAPFTNGVFSPAVTQEFTLPSSAELERLLPLSGPRLVFVNGVLAKGLSDIDALPRGVTFLPLQEALTTRAAAPLISQELAQHCRIAEEPLAAFNTAFLHDGAVVKIDAGADIPEVMQVLYVSTEEAEDAAVFPRILLVAEQNSKCTVLEAYVGLGPNRYCTAAVTELILREGAVLNHLKLVLEGPGALHLSTAHACVARGGRLEAQAYTFGGRLVRNEAAVELSGEGAEVLLTGLSLLGGNQHVDNHTVIDHSKPHCSSREIYKGVYAEQSAGVFDGTIIVRPGAQKTAAYQANRSLLLSREAVVNSKPQLRIWADDVKCTHGATVGQIDEDALFYLRSRGIGCNEAYQMLTKAFVSEVLAEQKNQNHALSAWLETLVEKRLSELPRALGADPKQPWG